MSDDNATLDDIKKKQVELLDKALALTKEKNAEKLMTMTRELKKMGDELALKAQVFETKMKAQFPKAEKGSIKVELTDEQRQRIGAATGIDMPIFVIDDAKVTMNKMIAHMTPDAIEAMALRKAQRIVAEREAKMEAKKQMAGAVGMLDKIDSKDHQKILKELKKDPNFLGGMLRDGEE